MILEILFEDDHFIAINKPAGLLVHRTKLAKDEESIFALQLLRDQIGQRVYPLHRIDRPTSGVLLFSKSADDAALLQPDFAVGKIRKYYLTIVRGYTQDSTGIIDLPLKKDLDGSLQDAVTEFWSLGQVEIPMASSARYPTSRYSLLKIYPHTGRMHQIRRHLAKERHYVIGDTTHGDNKQNRFFREQYGMSHFLLHAWSLHFSHPNTHQEIEIIASLPEHFLSIMERFNWQI
jgi:tRNA pseudouridine65 synthase